jgi:glycerophosphoryl diester phosphodiesterase
MGGMRVICHRGYWKDAEEKNTAVAFQRGFALGLGTETDIRDLNGQLVISHDPPQTGAMLFTDFLRETPKNVLLALNVKSDGITDKAVAALQQSGHQHYLFFDMSVPDMRSYLRRCVPTAMRLSEYEGWIEEFARQSDYIWLDAFDSDWYDLDTLQGLLNRDKVVLVVSAELHGRNPESQWALLEQLSDDHRLVLCTDLPELALERFTK